MTTPDPLRETRIDTPTDWHAHGMAWALTDASSPNTHSGDEWTTDDVARAFEAGAIAALASQPAPPAEPVAEVHSDTLRWLIPDDDPRRPMAYALLYTAPLPSAQPAPAAAQGDWVMVPREPTEAMLAEAFRSATERLLGLYDNMDCTTDEERSAKAYRMDWAAMLAAAPQAAPPAPSEPVVLPKGCAWPECDCPNPGDMPPYHCERQLHGIGQQEQQR